MPSDCKLFEEMDPQVDEEAEAARKLINAIIDDTAYALGQCRARRGSTTGSIPRSTTFAAI